MNIYNYQENVIQLSNRQILIFLLSFNQINSRNDKYTRKQNIFTYIYLTICQQSLQTITNLVRHRTLKQEPSIKQPTHHHLYTMPLNPAHLQEQNKRLQRTIDQYMQEIQYLKTLNQQHQKQIESLLKFNERLLTIIEEEINNNPLRLRQRSLQPISQVTQVDSETMQQMMQELQKTRNKLAARSQKGGTQYRSQIQLKNTTSYNPNANLNHYLHESKDLQRSQRYVPTTEIQPSQFGNKSSFSKKRQKKIHIPKHQFGSRQQLIEHELSIEELQRASTDARPLVLMRHAFGDVDSEEERQHNQQEYMKLKEEINKKIQWEINEVRKNAELNHQFLDSKINQLTQLSKQVTYNPQQKFNELQTKIKLSHHLASIVKKAMTKKN